GMIYTVTDDHGTTATTSAVVLVDNTTAVVLRLVDSHMTVECHGAFADPGATASDACAGNLSSAIEVTGSVDANTVGNYTLSYSVSDGHGNTATASRLVHVVDSTAPTLTLVGGDMTVECHGTFADPGATASDACAGNLSSAIEVTGSVDA